jgi:serpin B
VLPKAGGKLVDVETALLRGDVTKAVAQEQVAVRLPSFKIAGTHRLREVLLALGVRAAFGAADFSGIAEERLTVYDVVHQTWIQVDEKGCEAAGATAVVMKLGGRPPAATKTFVADRPFAFTLRDRTTGLVLFIGRVDDPRTGADAAPPMQAPTKG